MSGNGRKGRFRRRSLNWHSRALLYGSSAAHSGVALHGARALLELGRCHHGWLLGLPLEEILVPGDDELDIVRPRRPARFHNALCVGMHGKHVSEPLLVLPSTPSHEAAHEECWKAAE